MPQARLLTSFTPHARMRLRMTIHARVSPRSSFWLRSSPFPRLSEGARVAKEPGPAAALAHRPSVPAMRLAVSFGRRTDATKVTWPAAAAYPLDSRQPSVSDPCQALSGRFHLFHRLSTSSRRERAEEAGGRRTQSSRVATACAPARTVRTRLRSRFLEARERRGLARRALPTSSSAARGPCPSARASAR